MAPKKRPRLAPPTTATSIADVSKVQLKLGEWLQEASVIAVIRPQLRLMQVMKVSRAGLG